MYVIRRLSHLKHRLAVGVVLALCLGHLQVAQASKLPDFSRSGVNYTGKSASVGMTGSGTSYGSTVPVSPPVGGGWQYAGNYGIPQPATGPTMTMSAKGDVFFAGTKYPFQAGYAVPKANIVDGMMALAGGPLGLALFALPYAFDWLTKAGGRTVTDPSGKIVGLERSDPSVCSVAPCEEVQFAFGAETSVRGSWAPKSNTLPSCTSLVDAMNATYPTDGPWVFVSQPGGALTCRFKNGSNVNSDATRFDRTVAPSPDSWLPSSMDDIAPYMKSDSIAPDGRVVQELLDKGVDFTMPNPTVTGPSSIEGPTKETANSDGSKTVEKTTYNFNTSGNTITNTTNNTTTTIYNADNSVRNVTNTTNAPTDEEQIPKDCDKDSSTVGCSKLETPEDKPLPKADKNITYTAESWFGGGSCPADKIVTVGGQQVKAWDWTVSCDYLVTYGRPLILAAAAFMALMILAPGVKE